jgi:LysM repeat protein
MISSLFTVVAVSGLAVVITALVMFFPGTNAIEPVAASENPEAAASTTEVSTSAAATTTEADSVTSTAAETSSVTSVPVSSGAPGDGPPLLAAPLVPYRVERGDTVESIAFAVGIDPLELLGINQLPEGSELGVGTVLLVPGVDEEQRLVPAVLAENPDRVGLVEVFQRWADQYEVPGELLMAVGWHASQWDHELVGEEGEIGIMQLDGDVASWVAGNIVGIPLDAAVESENIQLAAAYLGWLLTETEGDTSASLAAYYDGLTSQRNIPWRQDTVEYISSVLGLRPVFDPRAAINTGL